MTMDPILDPRTQLLVALSAAVAAKCQKCFAKLYATVEQAGATDQEVRSTVAIATKVAEKSDGFMAAFIAQTTHGAVAGTGDQAPSRSGCGCA
jgi:alkylhydroperoxidase/carboxymuconolactone decarboxylase family protein YurZ